MSIKLDVPLVLQRQTMECWYASVCMVNYFHEQGPRLGLPEKWEANNGINLGDFIRLAQVEKLQTVQMPTQDLTAQQLEVFLRNLGPLWCAGHWDGVPHIVVLTGVDNGTVYINDPNPNVGKRVETLSWFNNRRDPVPNGIMYRKKN